MPYTKKAERRKFFEGINDSVQLIMSGTDPVLVKGEYFGHWLDRVARKYMEEKTLYPRWNCHLFSVAKRESLNKAADRIVSSLNLNDALSSAGDLNYAISSVYWGILGEAADVPQANYGFRVYTKGIIRRVLQSLGAVIPDIIHERRFTILTGVLHDVILEGYRQQTVPYEDGKIVENGTLWIDGKLND